MARSLGNPSALVWFARRRAIQSGIRFVATWVSKIALAMVRAIIQM
jgi:hypothetical protein